MPKKVLAERRFKAGQFFQSARVAVHEKRWLEAAASARLAIAFDPWNREYKQQFASIQAEVHAARAVELLEQADGADVGSDALKLLEEAIHYRPADAALHLRAARIAFDTGDYEKAREYAQNSCELDPENAEHPLAMARALRRLGETLAAMEALKAAAKISPQHPEIAAERKLLRRGR
jgi:tetratricopeptide (TPR) repeat protein